ncbi:Cucumisin [Vitis vinifera]|uniref:Cucumisin n=1 Tax=Vitis vinifera TaxID=29760 RepID=A0A438JXE1_VITVI|nr:Cucumisin [Vitis vinifera]
MGLAHSLAGAVGALMADTLPKDSSRSFPLPASHLSARDGSSIANYINSTSNPNSSIFKSTEVSDALAPYVVSFSSRGPTQLHSTFSKPDIAAPGVRILAAWPPIAPVSGVKGDNREVLYNIISGTSMSCPHASGAAAYIKSFNPHLVSCCIKSALMTTATPMSAKKKSGSRICIWCGQYRSCKGYRSWSATNGTVWNLNYPSFALSSLTKESITGMFNRTVTNVGSSVSTYKATVIGAPEGLEIQVEPSILSFTSLMQKLSFVLKVEGKVGDNIVSASLVWDDGVHQVRTPIVVLALP